MTKEQAQEIANKFNNDTNQNIFVCSDSAVYLNSPLSVIENHCKENNLELFVIKNDLAEAKTAPKEVAEKKKKS